MNNLIVKTALKTLLGIVIAVIVAFGVASLGFPSAMASMWENFGNYSFATGYSSLAYSYSGSAEDLAQCLKYSVLAENNADTVKYGDKLIAHEDFEAVCRSRDEENTASTDYAGGYKQFVCGRVALAKYASGDFDGALSCALYAMEGVSDFPAGNALIVLSLEIIRLSDDGAAQSVLALLENYAPSGEVQENAYEVVKTELGKI